MRFATYRMGLAVLVGLVLAATGLWAGGEEEAAGSRCRQAIRDRPGHRQGVHRAGVWRNTYLRIQKHC